MGMAIGQHLLRQGVKVNITLLNVNVRGEWFVGIMII